MESGVRIGDGRKVSVGKKFKWELPETEEGWAAYQERWRAAVAEEEARVAKRSRPARASGKVQTKATATW